MLASSSSSDILRILLVEDHVLTRIGLKAIIEKSPDLQVVGEAGDGQEAVQLADSLAPDVVLMDVGLPIMNGIEASFKIKSNHPKTEIIMLTSHDDDGDILAALTSGASGYCLKDVEPERLYIAIRAVSSGDIWLDSAIAKKVIDIYTKPRTDHGAHNSAASGAPATDQTSELRGPLSKRELEVLNLLVGGFSNQQISSKLCISLATTKTHVRSILNKLCVDDRTQAAVMAMKKGLI